MDACCQLHGVLAILCCRGQEGLVVSTSVLQVANDASPALPLAQGLGQASAEHFCQASMSPHSRIFD